MKKRLLAWVLSFALALSLLPVGVLAAGEIYSGSCGENVTWDFDGVGTLSIMGTGAMYNYADSNSTSPTNLPPWSSFRDAIQKVVIGTGITTIGNYAFQLCKNLENVIIPSGIVTIGAGAFADCSGLKNAVIPEGVTNIQKFAFIGCSSLTSIAFPDTLNKLGHSAFYGCSQLTSVAFPDSMSTIDYSAFVGCNLENIILPDGINVINRDTFSNCHKYKKHSYSRRSANN